MNASASMINRSFRLTGLCLMISFFLVSCSRDNPPEDEIPEWIQVLILQDLAIIRDSPHLMNNYGAWYRYLYMGKPYFQYENPLSSSSLQVFDVSGNRINLYEESYENYFAMRCCRKLIWKAPRFVDIGL